MTTHGRPLALAARGIPDLLAAVPILLGFHPSDSVCLLGVQPRDTPGTYQVVSTFLTDLPAGRANLARLRASLRDLLDRESPDGVLLVGYGPAVRVTAAVDAFWGAAAEAGVPVLEAVRVTSGRYWSYLCDDPDCCPAEGVPFEPSTRALTTAAVVHGVVVQPSRDHLADTADLTRGTTAAAVRDATVQARRWLAERRQDDRPGAVDRLREAGVAMARAGVAAHEAGERLSVQDVARLSVLLSDLEFRDLLVIEIAATSGGLDGHVALWTDLTQRAQTNVAACATVLAFAAWRGGKTTLAAIAVCRALREDPGYRLAQMLDTALAEGIPPAAFEEFFDELAGGGA